MIELRVVNVDPVDDRQVKDLGMGELAITDNGHLVLGCRDGEQVELVSACMTEAATLSCTLVRVSKGVGIRRSLGLLSTRVSGIDDKA